MKLRKLRKKTRPTQKKVVLFKKFVAYKTQGLFTKAFPSVTLKELRQWKKENSIENSSREQGS